MNRPKPLALLYSINWSHNVFGPLGTRQTLMPTDTLAWRSTLELAANTSAVNGEALCDGETNVILGLKLGWTSLDCSSLNSPMARFQQTLPRTLGQLIRKRSAKWKYPPPDKDQGNNNRRARVQPWWPPPRTNTLYNVSETALLLRLKGANCGTCRCITLLVRPRSR